MNSQLTAFITLICTSGVLNIYLGLKVYLKRHLYTNIASFFMLYTGSIAIYCFASAFSLTASSLEQIKFWNILIYVGMPISAPLGLLFIMQYLGFKLSKKSIAAILFIPLMTFGMVLTNDLHQLHYKILELDPNLGAPYVRQEIGIWYIVHGLYTFASMLVAFLLVLSRWKETARTYRPQLIALMFGQFVPILTAFLYLIGYTPAGIDPVPMVLWLSSLLYLWSINSSRLFTVMPITKNAIFNSINDGVMVLDERNRIIEYNDACVRMFPPLKETVFGMKIEKVWLELTADTFPSVLKKAGATLEIPFQSSIYQVRTSPMQHQNTNGLLMIFSDITELKNLQVKLEQLAYYDELTQIYNRRAFFQHCEKEFAEAKSTQIPFTVILMDIDYFKKVNDTYGHPIGDQLLVHVAKGIQSQLKDEVLFARYGGEEFILAIKGRTLSEGQALANHLREWIEAHPLQIEDNHISVTASFGVSEATKEEGETIYQLLNKADKALYMAKHKGRNQVQVFTRVRD